MWAWPVLVWSNDFSNKNKYLEPSLPKMPNTDKIRVRKLYNI